MTVPTADRDIPRVALDRAATIARSLTPEMATQLRHIIERDISPGHGWSDMRINRCLHARGLVDLTYSDTTYRSRGHWVDGREVTDVQPSRHAVLVFDVYTVLDRDGELRGPLLGRNQKWALRCLQEQNNGQWSPGCGWMWDNTSATVRILDGLAKRGLAVRSMTAAGEPLFVITAAGRVHARPLVRRVADLRHAASNRKDAR